MAWVRPSDWLVMPTSVANQINILAAVSNDASNYVALSATVVGGFTVDWGDGDITTHASAATAEHTYDYADAGLGALTTRGYKQAMIKITATVEATAITAFDLGVKHTRTSLNAYSQPWLDIQVNCPSATSMAYRGGVDSRMVERITIVAIGAVTTLASAFNGCYSLESITFPAGSLTAVTSLAGAFQNCLSLQTVSFPAGSLANVTTLATAFTNCSRLQSVTFPAGSLASVTTIASIFQTCYALRQVSFPEGSLVSTTTIASAFQTCTSLREMSFPAGSLASVNTILSVFNGASALQTVTFPTGSLSAVTTIATAFNNCSSLRSIAFPSGALAVVVTTTTAFGGCTALARIQNCAIPVSFSVASTKLAGAQLDEIYTALPSVAATITVSTNHGTPDDTPSIATGKGWTVTGS
jgi:hypothetical protein